MTAFFMIKDGLCLLQSQSSGGQVADLGGSEVLDGTGVHEAGLNGPLSTVLSEELEGCAVQLHQSLTDNGATPGLLWCSPESYALRSIETLFALHST